MNKQEADQTTPAAKDEIVGEKLDDVSGAGAARVNEPFVMEYLPLEQQRSGAMRKS